MRVGSEDILLQFADPNKPTGLNQPASQKSAHKYHCRIVYRSTIDYKKSTISIIRPWNLQLNTLPTVHSIKIHSNLQAVKVPISSQLTFLSKNWMKAKRATNVLCWKQSQPKIDSSHQFHSGWNVFGECTLPPTPFFEGIVARFFLTEEFYNLKLTAPAATSPIEVSEWRSKGKHCQWKLIQELPSLWFQRLLEKLFFQS